MSGRTNYSLLALLFAGLLHAFAPGVCAQTENESEIDPSQRIEQEPARSGDVIYLPDGDGGYRAVPVGDAEVPSILDLLQTDAEAGADVPDYFLAGLGLDGAVVDDWAQLSARVEVHVVTDDRWLRVPLRFDQGLLLSFEHQGDGQAAPAEATADENGLVWLFRGKGKHTLTLSFRVPLRRTASGSQLLLFLPKRSEYFGGDLRLKLPPESFVEPSDTVHLLSESAGDAEVHALLPGDRIDLRWRPVVKESSPITRTMTSATVRLRSDLIQYTARQEIRLRSAGLSHLDVRLPSAGFRRTQAVRINDLSGTERTVTPQSADREGWVRVPLEGVSDSLVTLDWTFEMPFDESTHQLTIDGLEIADADDQSGTISFEGFDRHLLTRRPDAVEGVFRIGVDRLPAAGTFANLAFGFETGSYRLVLDVDPIESTFRVTPIHLLDISRFRVRLTSRYLMSIDEGQVDALSLVWPYFEEQGWTIDPLTVDVGEIRRDQRNDEAVSDESDSDENESAEHERDESEGDRTSPTRFLLQPTRALTNQAQTGFSAERLMMPVDDQAEFSLSLPQVAGARTLPGILVVTTADEVEAGVRAGPKTHLGRQRTIPDTVRQWLEDQDDPAGNVYSLQEETEGGGTAIDVSVRIQQLQVSARSVVRVDQIETDPQITQQFDFEVAFGRISSVRLRVPEEITGDIAAAHRDQLLTFWLDETPLAATWRRNEVQLALPQPRRGAFQIVAGPYGTESLRESPSALRIPVMTIADRRFDSLRLVVPTAGTAEVEVADEDWTRLTTAVGADEWVTSRTVEAVEIGLDHSLQKVPQQVSIPVAWFQSHIDLGGTSRTMAQYQLEPDVSQLVVKIPGDPDRHRFFWDGEDVGSVEAVAEIRGQYLIELPERSRSGWLGIEWVANGKPLGWGRSTHVEFPAFGGGVILEQTYWDLHLPLTQYLWHNPAGLSPQFAWMRSGLVWSRETVADARQSRLQFVADGAAGANSPESANVYSFETLGTMHEVTVRSTNNALLVFVGAGLTLLGSFLVLKMPAARSLWLWLLAGGFVAVASLWYLDVILLLLQPAAYGLVLPLVAMMLDRGSDRTTLSETLSTGQSLELAPEPSDEAGSSSGSPRDVSSTLVRPTVMSDSGVS